MEIHFKTANSEILAYEISSFRTQLISSGTKYSVTYSHPSNLFWNNSF